MTLDPLAWLELTPLPRATFSAVPGLFKLSTSDADDGDSPDKNVSESNMKNVISLLHLLNQVEELRINNET